MIQPITVSADALRAASFCPIGHPNSVKCMNQSFFQKAFNQNFCFFRLVRTDSASQRPSSISALFSHSLGHGMDARLRLGRLAEHVIGFCTSTWTAAYVALTSAMFG
jgi:hypothetical protein